MKDRALLPAALLLIGIIALPLAAAVPSGVSSLARLGEDLNLRRIAANTLLFSGVSVALELLLGVPIALLLHRRFRLRGGVRATAILPWALPSAVMAMSWRWIFSDTFGIASDLPMRLGLASQPIPWLGLPATAFASLIVADVWKTTPFVAILSLAALQTIPRDLDEAMAIDGGGPARRFFMVTLPLLRPALAVAVTFRLIHAIGIFDLVWVLTGGGPANATKTLAVYVYEQYFLFGDRGYATAITLATAVAMFAISVAMGRLIRGRAPA